MTQRLTLNDVQIAQILGRIADCADAVKDPDFRKRLRADVLTLPEEVQAASDKAQAYIAQAVSLKAKIKDEEESALERLLQREKAVAVRETAMEALNSRKADAEAIENSNKTKETELKAQASLLASISAGHQKAQQENASRKKALDDLEAGLNARANSLDKRAEEISKYEQEINETAQQMSGLVKSKLRK